MTATLSAKRARALSNACRGAQSVRLVHSSSINQATALSSASLTDEKIQEITLQPIFDIFDAPTRLAQSGEFIRSKYASSSTAGPSSPVTPRPTPRSGPTPLPQPILFDGPARPKNAILAFQSRLRDAGLRTPSTPSRPANNTTPTRPFSSSEPSVQLFDGPARITRYHHRPSSGHEQNSAKYMVAIGVAGAIGGAAFYKDGQNQNS